MSNQDENLGVDIVRQALEGPVKHIAGNAGKDGAVIIDNVRHMVN